MATYADVIAPIAALGQSQLEVVSNFAVDSTYIAFVTPNANYVVGDSVWVAHAAGYSLLQYRGLVTARNGNNGVYTSIQAFAQCASGTGRIWKATSYCQFAFSQNSPVKRFEFGKRIRLSQGGTPYVTATTASSEIVGMSFDLVSITEYLAFQYFVITTLSFGLLEFTLSWFDYSVNLVRTAKVVLFSPLLAPSSPSPNMVSFSVEFLIVTENIYEA